MKKKTITFELSVDRPTGFWSRRFSWGQTGLIREEMNEAGIRMVGSIMAFYGKCGAMPVICETCGGRVVIYKTGKMDIDPEVYRIKEGPCGF